MNVGRLDELKPCLWLTRVFRKDTIPPSTNLFLPVRHQPSIRTSPCLTNAAASAVSRTSKLSTPERGSPKTMVGLTVCARSVDQAMPNRPSTQSQLRHGDVLRDGRPKSSQSVPLSNGQIPQPKKQGLSIVEEGLAGLAAASANWAQSSSVPAGFCWRVRQLGGRRWRGALRRAMPRSPTCTSARRGGRPGSARGTAHRA